MDPNNLDNMPPVAPEQPIAPEQPVAEPAPIEQLVEQPMEQTVEQPLTEPAPIEQPMEQPMAEPAPMEQPMPGQPMMPPVEPQPMMQQPTGPQPMMPPVVPVGPVQPIAPEPNPMTQITNAPKKKNKTLIIGIIGIVILLAVGGVVLAMSGVFGGKKAPAPAPAPTPEPEPEGPVPTMALAKSVCEEYNGTFTAIEDALSDYGEVAAIYSCQRFKNMQKLTDGTDYVDTYDTTDFAYQVQFMKEDEVESYWSKMRTDLKKQTTSDSDFKVLKNDEDLIQISTVNQTPTASGENASAYGYAVVYKDAMLSIMGYNKNTTLIETIMEKLGFPEIEEEDDELDPDDDSKSSDTSSQGNTQRIKDYNALLTAIESYIVSHSGDISGILQKGDPSTLNSAKVINDTGMDPNGNPYETKAYSFATWAAAGEGKKMLMPSTTISDATRADGVVTTTGSQVFVITKANCGGSDANNKPAPTEDASPRSFAVYGYLEGGTYFCKTGANKVD